MRRTSLLTHPFAESLTESKDDWEELSERDQKWIRQWFIAEDKGDWSKCYEKCLEAQNPNAYKRYKTCSDSGKAYLAQFNFNKLPDEIIRMVDRDTNSQWLKRREEGEEGLNRLEKQFTKEDKEAINPGSINTNKIKNKLTSKNATNMIKGGREFLNKYINNATGHHVSTVDTLK